MIEIIANLVIVLGFIGYLLLFAMVSVYMLVIFKLTIERLQSGRTIISKPSESDRR